MGKSSAVARTSDTSDVLKFDITTRTTAADVEEMLCTIGGKASRGNALMRLARNTSLAFFTDAWISMLIATTWRVGHSVNVEFWSAPHGKPEVLLSWAQASLPSCTAIMMANTIIGYDEWNLSLLQDMLTRLVRNDIAPLEDRGLLKEDDWSRTICEFDPDASLAAQFGGTFPDMMDPTAEHERKVLFHAAIRRIRTAIESRMGAHDRVIMDEGAARHLVSFLFELHENSYQHGRFDGNQPRRQLAGLRVVRVRRHLTSYKDELLRNSEHVPPLYRFIEATVPSDRYALVEVSVSDFGLGIVDFVLTSPIGRWYKDQPRRQILELALANKFSTKTGDAGAGDGLSNALNAVRAMQGFVSVRTGEFWLQRAFGVNVELDSSGDITLDDMFVNRPLGAVAGTHWNLFYHRPLT